jgi:hypothetical protein
MARFQLGSAGALLLIAFAQPTDAQPLSQLICLSAQSYFGQNPPAAEVLLASNSISSGAQWVPASSDKSPIGQNDPAVYLAYFFSAPYGAFSGPGQEAAGAISIKVSVIKEQKAERTSSIELYRPAIPRGANRCEPSGRRAIEVRRLGINEYIDYHARRGNSSNVEDFHFQYPYAKTECARTDRPQAVSDTFQFDAVKPISNDTVAALLFGRFVGVVYALNTNDFSRLRTELHYYNRTNTTTPACVGFQIPLSNLEKTAAIVIHDLSANWYSPRGSWLIHRQ